MGTTLSDDAAAKKEPEGVSFQQFFEAVPPGRRTQVIDGDMAEFHTNMLGGKSRYTLTFPEITLHCGSERCGGDRVYKREGETLYVDEGLSHNKFVVYRCKNCGRSHKTYALNIAIVDKQNAWITKFGEVPEFGPPIPPKVSKLLGGARDFFFKGRRAENQGLGIAAFAYYRRVVDDQKDKIFDEIIKVAEKLNAGAELIDELKAAKSETQFTKAIEAVKHGLPQVLMIDGHNPLTLLHTALSDGLHDRSDAECLELASTIRVVLYDLIDRAATALRANDELRLAVGRLTNPKPAKT